MIQKSFRQESKRNYVQELEDNEGMCLDQLKLGAIMRIADAIEIIAKEHQSLIEERNRYKRWFEDERQITKRLVNRNTRLRGYIKRKNVID